MELRETVNKYLALAGGYGKSVALSAFGLSREETERVFAGVEAIWLSLMRQPQQGCFDFFVLSDTRDAAVARR